MATKFRVASFNVENLFSRARILNLRDHSEIDGKLKRVDQLNKLINQPAAFTPEQKKQIVSKPLKDELVNAGVERGGIYDLRRITGKTHGQIPVETEFDTVTHWTEAASDHAATWAEFRL